MGIDGAAQRKPVSRRLRELGWKLSQTSFAQKRLLPRFRRGALAVAERVVGRELAYLDFDALLEKGVVSVGRHSYARPLIHHIESAGLLSRVEIGSFSSIANNSVFLIGNEHHTDWITTSPYRNLVGTDSAEVIRPFSRGDIRVGSDVWIAAHALILSGVTIGHGAVVGAGAVVAKDVEPYAVVVGNPGRPVRKRFSDREIESLLRIRWWDWDDAKIQQEADLIWGNDISTFVERFDPEWEDHDIKQRP